MEVLAEINEVLTLAEAQSLFQTHSSVLEPIMTVE